MSKVDCERGDPPERQSSTVLALDDLCPQVKAIVYPEHEASLRDLDKEFSSSEFRCKAYESLGAAIRISTECYDGLPPEDPHWKIMGEFHEYLEARFPKVHASLKRTKVNTYALVYEWKGTKNIKPLLLSAHMDVVPVASDTLHDWKQPPYSGYYDGEWIWGRGSSDDKAPLIAVLTAVETLLERGFIPLRTVLLAFGYDEECGGRMGAGKISEHLLGTYGPDSLAMIVDEGGEVIDLNGMIFALPAVTEKGFMNIRIEVSTPGGHSSTPPKHTGIGILADLITALETYPQQPKLIRGGPYYQKLECRAKYDPGFPESLTKLLLESRTSDEKLRELGDRLIDFDPRYYALAGTTQAFDLIQGGVKANALPETAWVVANNRIADHSSLAELMAHYTNITRLVAVKHKMTLVAFGKIVGPEGSSGRTIRLSDFDNNALEPAPVTPTTGSGPYELLSGTILSSFKTHLRSDHFPRSAVVSPGIFPGDEYWCRDMFTIDNPDTRHYWKLTKHIFRYAHKSNDDLYNGIHTVNEAIRAEAFLEQIRFFTRLILNADQSDVLE